ncbi:MAG TPA: DUF4149 domain-containing protein [Gemmatimonadaceae bacterium]|nr:DUF4149 domain-containing protein [Gemmatimonadaceae bacterium]
MSRTRASATVAALLLSAWLGAALFFSAIVAPAAFRTLPEASMAGALVRATLPPILYAGIIVGLASLWLGASGAPVSARGVRAACGAGVAVCCAVAQFVAVRQIDRVRAQLTAPLESLAPNHPVRLTFGRLHALSVGLLGLSMLLAAVAVVLSWRAGLASSVSPE